MHVKACMHMTECEVKCDRGYGLQRWELMRQFQVTRTARARPRSWPGAWRQGIISGIIGQGV